MPSVTQTNVVTKKDEKPWIWIAEFNGQKPDQASHSIKVKNEKPWEVFGSSEAIQTVRKEIGLLDRFMFLVCFRSILLLYYISVSRTSIVFYLVVHGVYILLPSFLSVENSVLEYRLDGDIRSIDREEEISEIWKQQDTMVSEIFGSKKFLILQLLGIMR